MSHFQPQLGVPESSPADRAWRALPHTCTWSFLCRGSLSATPAQKFCVFPDGQTSKDNKSELISCPCFGVLFLKCRIEFPQSACGTLDLHPNEDVGSLPINATTPWTPKCPHGWLWHFCLSPTTARVLPSSTTVLPQLLVEERRKTGLWIIIFFYRKAFIYLFEEGEQPSLEP